MLLFSFSCNVYKRKIVDPTGVLGRSAVIGLPNQEALGISVVMFG